MNQETQKQLLLKIVLVSGVACAGWMLLVKPALARVDTQGQTLESHQSLIQAHNQRVGSQDTNASVEVQKKLDQIFGAMSATIGGGDSGTALHSLLHESAGRFGISISRIESVTAREVTQRIAGSELKVVGANHTVRVEFEGDYNSAMSFMDEIASSPTPVQFTSFRFIPIGPESVRVNAEIDLVMLTFIPSHRSLVVEE